MGDVSQPGWEVLRESSASSAAPSEDELQSAHEGMASLSRASPTAAGSSTSRATNWRSGGGGSGSGVQGAALAGTSSSQNARRPLSDSDEGGHRIHKKKKRKIVDPEKEAGAYSKVSVTRLAEGRRPRLSDLPPPPSASSRGARGLTQVTLGTVALHRDEEQGGSTAEPVRSGDKQKTRTLSSQPSRSQKPALPRTQQLSRGRQEGRIGGGPSQRAQAGRDKATTNREGSRRKSAPVTPAEVIEIMDSDEEAAAPPIVMPLPRRKIRPPPKNYREVDGIILIDDSDEDHPLLATAPSTSMAGHIAAVPVQSPSVSTSSAQISVNEPQPSQTLSNVASPINGPGSENLTVRDTLPSPDRPGNVEMLDMPPQQDVDMVDGVTGDAANSHTVADTRSVTSEGMGCLDHDTDEGDNTESNISSALTDTNLTEPTQAPVTPAVQPIHQQERDYTEVPSSPPPYSSSDTGVHEQDQELPSRDGSATLDTPSSPRAMSPQAPDTTLTLATPQPTLPESQNGFIRSPVCESPVVAPVNDPSDSRAATASPVSTILAPPLKYLALSGNPQEVEMNRPSSSAISTSQSRHNSPASPRRARSRSHSQKPTTPIRPTLRWKGKSIYTPSFTRIGSSQASGRSSSTSSSSARSTALAQGAPTSSPLITHASPSSNVPSVREESAEVLPIAVPGAAPQLYPSREDTNVDRSMHTEPEEGTQPSTPSPEVVMDTKETQHKSAIGPTTAPEPILVETNREENEEPTTTVSQNASVKLTPLKHTLSQVIRDARKGLSRLKGLAGNAHANPGVTKPDKVADPTPADEMDAARTDGAQNAMPAQPASLPLASAPAAPSAPATPQTIKTLNLVALSASRKKAAGRNSSSRLSPVLAKTTFQPLPRNLGRAATAPTAAASSSEPAASPPALSSPSMSSPSVTMNITNAASTALMEEVMSASNASATDPATLVPSTAASASLSTASSPVSPSKPPTLTLPRRQLFKAPQLAASAPLTAKIPPISRTVPVTHVDQAPSTPSDLEITTEVNAITAPPVLPRELPTHDDTPPHSPTEADDASEEEECLELIYPSSAPEDSTPENSAPEDGPEIETADGGQEDEEEQAPRGPTGRRARIRWATIETGGSMSTRRSRRSGGVTSSSASSSVEPPEELGEPRMRLRRRAREPVVREPAVRTSSEEDLASQGGISRENPQFAQAFESAGFGAISWKKDKRRIAKEFAPIAQLAENIPTDLHDRLNALSAAARRAGNMQVLIFEAEIRANTAEDEPNAPPIRIVNAVDDEPTPPLEFYYSNLMWHGPNVPKPDYDGLEGCGCTGPCDPTSRSCSCVRRQRKYWDGAGGFLYDRKGKLKSHEYPIFECNMNCGCSDDCSNRVIQLGRQHEISIQKTPNKGWGIFAGPKKIPANTFVGVYAGEYLLVTDGDTRAQIYDNFGRTYLFDIDFYHIKRENGNDKAVYCIDAYHAGNFTRYLNHSCDPNCAIVAAYINEANINKPLLAIFTQKEVEPYEELCFSYRGDNNDGSDDEGDEPAETLSGAVFMKCQCGAANCTGRMWK